MLSGFFCSPLVFVFVAFGLAWPIAARLNLDPAEKLCATAVLSLLGTYLITFAIYLLGFSFAAAWCLPALGLIGLIRGHRELRVMATDADVRALCIGQILIMAWCVGLLALIVSYSGGGWAGDWYEHWERTEFFVYRWPVDTKFLGAYPLPARPPLANLVTGALIAPSVATFAKYQVATTLLNCLVFIPGVLLARRFQRATKTAASIPGMVAVFTLFLMVNPSFVENATFAWTKLFAAFFVLAGVYFFLRSHDADAPRAAAPLCAVSLAAGILTHYSAGPYVVVLAVAWFVLNFRRASDPTFWRLTFTTALIGGAILATWFAWSIATYGLVTTVSSNSSAAVEPEWRGRTLLKVVLNLRDTIVPHFLRRLDHELIEQTSTWGSLRDWAFQLYQVNLLFVFGSVAWLVLLVAGARAHRDALPRQRGFWSLFVVGTIVLGVGVHGARDHWGLAHICLQPLTVLGLGFLAARWSSLGQRWKLAVILGAVIDFALGIALQFGVQSFELDRWLGSGRSLVDQIASYTPTVKMNLYGKLVNHLDFVSDALGSSTGLVTILLGAVLLLALARRREVRRRLDSVTADLR